MASGGRLAVNKWGNEQASFKVESLKELVAEAETSGKEWVNLSVFESKEKNNNANSEPQGNTIEEINDAIPF